MSSNLSASSTHHINSTSHNAAHRIQAGVIVAGIPRPPSAGARSAGRGARGLSILTLAFFGITPFISEVPTERGRRAAQWPKHDDDRASPCSALELSGRGLARWTRDGAANVDRHPVRQSRNPLWLQGISFVAGAGFEPATFGL